MSRAPLVLALALTFLAALPAAGLAAARDADRAAAERALTRVKDLRQGIGVRTGRELTPALLDLARRKDDLGAAAREQADSFLARPTQSGDSDFYGGGFLADVRSFCAGTSIFCIHWVDDAASSDAPSLTDTDADTVPDFVESMAAAFNEVYACENGSGLNDCGPLRPGLDWQDPVGDGTAGGVGNNKFDVYVADLSNNLYGYATTETCPTAKTCAGYMVMNNDYSPFATATVDATEAMQVTAAHEYNHILQFGYDVTQDTWMLEATATYMEEKVYPAIDDYLNYLPNWVQKIDIPLTTFDSQDVKVYGSAVWNHWLDREYGGDDVIQSAWQQSKALPSGFTSSFAPDAYRKAITDAGGAGFSEEFAEFAVATAEWRATPGVFPDAYPDVPRDPTALVVDGTAVTRTLDHTTHALLSVPVPGVAKTYTLTASLPAGVKGAIALVGRTGGSTTSGSVTTKLKQLPSGGAGSVVLPDAETYGRITAVLVNSDATKTGSKLGNGDWNWNADNKQFTNVRVTSSDTPAPPPAPPSAATSTATEITAGGATLNGSVNPNGKATTWYFEYGPDATRIPAVAGSAGSGTSAVPVSAAVTGLAPGTTVGYRLVAANADGTVAGSSQSFRTLDPPLVTTGPAGAVSATSAVLTGTVDPRGKAATYTFEYGPTTAYGQKVGGSVAQATGAASVAESVAGLAPGTVVHYRLIATTTDGTTAGGDRTFTTAADTSGTTESTPSSAAIAPLTLAVSVIRSKLGAVLRKGLGVRIRCGSRCRLAVKLVIPAKLAKRLGVEATLATVRTTASPAATVKLRISRKTRRALARARTLRARVIVRASGADGRKASLSKSVTLRR